MIAEKLRDLLILEARANELYKEALRYPEARAYEQTINEIADDEMEHVKLVKRILELI
jgi:rubrerythrin